MTCSWREQLTQRPELKDIRQWPHVDIQSLSAEHRKAYLRNREIVALILTGQKLITVADQYHLSLGRISQLMTRCLGSDNDEGPSLTQGLIPYHRVTANKRQAPLPTVTDKRGTSCALSAVFDALPGLVTELDEILIADMKDQANSQHITPERFHDEFKQGLIDKQWPTDTYPYTTEKVAYESLRHYFYRRKKTLRAEKYHRQKRPMAAEILSQERWALRAIEIDEHTVDCKQKVLLALNEEMIPLKIARITTITAIDVDSDCVLAGICIPDRSPNQQDFLSLLYAIVTTSHLKPLTSPGMYYPDTINFPSELQPPVTMALGEVHLDNALIHLANSVKTVLCDQLGATLHLGLPGKPKARRWIESSFNYCNKRLSHRVRSTTGSHPNDPIKESSKNAKKAPLMTYKNFEEAYTVTLARHNHTEKAHLGAATPLALFEHLSRTQYIRHIPTILREQWNPFISREQVPLKWYHHENREPHVNFYDVRHTARNIAPCGYQQETIIVEYDRRDIRVIRGFTLTGESIGEFRAPYSWLRFPHSLSTRQLITSLVRKKHFHAVDPLVGFFRHCLKNRNTESGALNLLKVYEEFTQDGSDHIVLNEKKLTPEKDEKNRQFKIEPWSVDNAFNMESNNESFKPQSSSDI